MGELAQRSSSPARSGSALDPIVWCIDLEARVRCIASLDRWPPKRPIPEKVLSMDLSLQIHVHIGLCSICKTASCLSHSLTGWAEHAKNIESYILLKMATPFTLAKPASAIAETIPEYDWKNQSRGSIIVGRYTSGSIQTYNSKGQPSDSKADQDD